MPSVGYWKFSGGGNAPSGRKSGGSLLLSKSPERICASISARILSFVSLRCELNSSPYRARLSASISSRLSPSRGPSGRLSAGRPRSPSRGGSPFCGRSHWPLSSRNPSPLSRIMHSRISLSRDPGSSSPFRILSSKSSPNTLRIHSVAAEPGPKGPPRGASPITSLKHAGNISPSFWSTNPPPSRIALSRSPPICASMHSSTFGGAFSSACFAFSLPSSILCLSSSDIRSCSIANAMHASRCESSWQYDSHALPWHPPGPLPPVFLNISASFSDMNPALVAKATHSSAFAPSSQYVRHSFSPRQPPGIVPPLSRYAATFSASCNSSSLIMPDFLAKSRHWRMLPGFSQNDSHESLEVQPPGPLPPSRSNSRACRASWALMSPWLSAKATHALMFARSSQYVRHSLLLAQLPSSGTGNVIVDSCALASAAARPKSAPSIATPTIPTAVSFVSYVILFKRIFVVRERIHFG